eukprot:1157216-Pelagomonas_calceolata.AAC.5
MHCHFVINALALAGRSKGVHRITQTEHVSNDPHADDSPDLHARKRTHSAHVGCSQTCACAAAAAACAGGGSPRPHHHHSRFRAAAGRSAAPVQTARAPGSGGLAAKEDLCRCSYKQPAAVVCGAHVRPGALPRLESAQLECPCRQGSQVSRQCAACQDGGAGGDGGDGVGGDGGGGVCGAFGHPPPDTAAAAGLHAVGGGCGGGGGDDDGGDLCDLGPGAAVGGGAAAAMVPARPQGRPPHAAHPPHEMQSRRAPSCGL